MEKGLFLENFDGKLAEIALIQIIYKPLRFEKYSVVYWRENCYLLNFVTILAKFDINSGLPCLPMPYLCSIPGSADFLAVFDYQKTLANRSSDPDRDSR